MNDTLIKKRELFRISIRRQQHESIFSKKRQLSAPLQDQVLDDWQTPLESLLQLAEEQQLITSNQHSLKDLIGRLSQFNIDEIHISQQLQCFLTNFFYFLQYIFPNEKDQWLDKNFIYVVELAQCYLITMLFNQFESSSDTKSIHNNIQELLKNMILLLGSFSQKTDISTLNVGFTSVIQNQIELFHYIEDFHDIEQISKFIINIVMDKSEQYISQIEQSSFRQILLEKFDTLEKEKNYQVLYQVYLYFAQLTDQTKKHGTIIFQESKKIISILDADKFCSDPYYYNCIFYYFTFIYNISNKVEENSSRTYQLFNLMIDYQLIFKVVDLLIKIDQQQKLIIEQGYRFLLNLSMIDSSYSMEQLINQQSLNLILIQIDDNSLPQYLLYPLLSNLITSNKIQTKQQILDSGVVGKISKGFEKNLEFRNYQDLVFILQSIINLCTNVTVEQSQYLLERSVIQYLFDYIIEIDIPLLDLGICNEIYIILFELRRINNAIKFQQSFLDKSLQLYEQLDDDCDLLESINNLLNITDQY